MSFTRIPYELVLGWRYTRAGRATRRNGFISFISGVSMLGIALGVAILGSVVMAIFRKGIDTSMLEADQAHAAQGTLGGALQEATYLPGELGSVLADQLPNLGGYPPSPRRSFWRLSHLRY